MKLSKLIHFHDSENFKEALSDNLGDSFLYKNNTIFRSVRNNFLKSKFNFSNQLNENDIVFPLAQLEDFFSTQKIPYINNVSALKKIEPRILDKIEWDEIYLGYKKNYLFHESCHVVAREIISQYPDLNLFLKIIFEESFANTCELFGMIEANEPAHRIFYEANSYSATFEDSKNIKLAVDKYGFDECFKYTVLSYVHSNFLFNAYSKNEQKSVLEFVFAQGIKHQDFSQIHFLSEMAFSLDEIFKYKTRCLYFKLNDLNESEFQTFRKQYHSGLFVNSYIRNILDTMVKVFYI